jgi:hypothetical protein
LLSFLEVDWHSGKSPTPFSKWDLESVALHEVGHGLFFTGVMQASPRQSLADFAFRNSRPARFDRFLGKSAGDGLAMCLAPADIFDTITSGSLRFVDPKSPDTTDFGLYSPSEYLPGSTTYHQDPGTLPFDCEKLNIPTNDCSDIMTQSLPNGYTQRHVGVPVTRMMNAMLGSSAGFVAAKACS